MKTLLTNILLAVTMLLGSASVFAESDLSIAVTVSPETAVIGDEIIYTCKVTNNGPDATTGMHGYIGPDDSSGTDVYMTFDTSEPPVTSIDQTGFRYITLPNIPAGGNTTFLVAYVATKAGSPVRLVGVSTDPFTDDPNPGNNSTNASVTINNLTTPTPPPHGGLSATQFTVNGVTVNPNGGGTDTVMKFAAVQTGNPAGLVVRVQASATPTVESSWVHLPNGSGGYMTRDETSDLFVLNSLNYPLQNGMHFRAISSAPGYPDSVSNVVGDYDLATSTAHVPPVTLFLATNGAGQQINFQGQLATALSGTTMRVQATTTPGDESSWEDLADGNGGAMFPYSNPTLFYLNTTKYPPGSPTYFRIVASHSGRIDSISNFVGVQSTVVGTAPEMEILPPFPEPGSGSGLTPLDPIIVSSGSLTFGVQLANSGTLSELALLYDGTVLETRNGGTSFSLPYFTTAGGDHVITGYGINSAGIKGYAPPVYIRIKPPVGKIFTRTSSGAWNDASKWKDGLGANGVPSSNDVAIIPFCTVDITANVSVYAVALNSATLHGAGGNLTVSQAFNITGSAAIKDLNTTVTSSGTVALWSDVDVPMSGSWINYGSFKFNGRGNIVPVTTAGTARALGAPQPAGFLDGVATFFTNIGKFFFPKPSTPIPAATPPPVTPPAVKPIRTLVASVFENKGQLIGPNGASLISPNGGTIVSPNGGTLISQDGASLISQDGGSIISTDGASLISQDGASLISQDGASIVSPNGGTVQNSLAPGAPTAGNSGLIQTSGETDLGGLTMIGDVSLQGGVLSGSGVIAGTLTNSAGFVSPGHSAGRIDVVGNFAQTADGTLIVEEGGRRLTNSTRSSALARRR